MAGFSFDELNDLLSDDNFEFPRFLGINMHDDHTTMIPTNHPMETPGTTLSNNQHGSNQPNQNIATGSTYASQETSNSRVFENGSSSMPQNDTSSFNADLLALLESDYHPTTGYLETGTSSGGLNQLQFNQATNLNISQAPYIGEESSEPPAVNYANIFEDARMSSLDDLLNGSPQPYRPVMDSFRTLDDNNQQPGVDGQNPDQDLSVSDYFTSENLDTPPVDSQNIWRTGSPSFNTLLQTTPQPNSPLAVSDLIPQPGADRSFFPVQEANPVQQPSQPITYPGNIPQTNNVLQSNQRTGSLNLGTPSFPNQPVDQNIPKNYFSNNINQPTCSQYQSSFPQNSALKVGNVNEGRPPIPYQQRAAWPSNARNIPYMPSSKLRPHKLSDTQLHRDIMKDSILDSHNSAAMTPERSESSRPGELAAQHQPQVELPPNLMPPNISNPLDFSHHFGSSASLRSSLPLPERHDQQVNQVPTAAVPSNTITSQRNTSKLPETSILSRSSLPLPDRRDQQRNQVRAAAAPSNATNSQRNKVKLPETSMRSRSSLPLPNRHDQQRNRVPAATAANGITSQRNNIKLRESPLITMARQSFDFSKPRHHSEKCSSWMDYLRPVTLAPKGYVLTMPEEDDNYYRDLFESLMKPPHPSCIPEIPILTRTRMLLTDEHGQYLSPFAPNSKYFHRHESVDNIEFPSKYSRPWDMGQFQGSPDPNSRSSESKFTGSTSPLASQSNSQTHQQGMGDNDYIAKMSKLFEGPLSSGNEKGKEKMLADSSSPFALGKSLYPCSGDKSKSPMFPPVSISDQQMQKITLSQEKNPQNGDLVSPPARVCENSAYDPKYEELGVPIDPHLRLFAKNKNKVIPDNYGNKRPRLDES